MPVAVPTGSYDVICALELAPLFSKVTEIDTIQLEKPAPETLERMLGDLESENVAVRRRTVLALRYFPENGDEVVPALMKMLDDEDKNIRTYVVSVMNSYPAHAGKHYEVFLEILASDDENLKANTAYLLGRFAPVSKTVEAALIAVCADAAENMKPRFQSALSMYQRRAKVQ